MREFLRNTLPIPALASLLFHGCVPAERSEKATETEPPPADSFAVSHATLTPPPDAIDPELLRRRAFKEAPELAARVRAGKLPPVAERLPENPLVVRPIAETGRYGGELRSAVPDEISSSGFMRRMLNENLMGYERPLPNSIELNLAESFRFSEDGTSAVFKIRRGIRWSDGAPFTADDILFFYHDMELDADARQSVTPLHFWLVDGRPMRLEKIDAYTLRFSAEKPLTRLLKALSDYYIAFPRHILAKYHPRYNSNASYEEFRRRTTEAARDLDPELPRLSAWYPVQWTRGQSVVYERNPYYWKVDTEGNQLPYADRVVVKVVSELESIRLRFINGELDFIGRYSHLPSYAALKRHENTGRYRLHLSGPGPGPVFYLNWKTPKKHLRQAIRDRRVRMAMSHAINREEVNQILYYGLLEPCGFSFRRPCPYFSREAYTRYSEYDPDKARALLAEAGYHDRDGDGFREFPDGSRFALTLDVAMDWGYEDICEFIAGYWGEIGIKVHLNIALTQILYPRYVTGDWDARCQTMEATVDPMGRPHYWMIMGPTHPFWHRQADEDAPPWLRRATRHLEEALETFDAERAHALMAKVRDIYSEEVPAIGVGSLFRVWGSSRRLGNVPENTAVDDIFLGWGRSLYHEQLFIR